MSNLLPVSPNWGNSISTEADINIGQLGIGGVVERDLKGINPLKTEKVVDIITKKYVTLENFLINNQGKPIRVPYIGGTDDGKLYRYSDWTIRYISPEVRGFTFTLKQVRRFKT